MSLPPGLVGESVEDAESRFSEPDRDPRGPLPVPVGLAKDTEESLLHLSLPGLCFHRTTIRVFAVSAMVSS